MTSTVIRYEKAVGIKLARLGRYTAELWIVPEEQHVPPHRHPNQQIELIPVYGKAIFDAVPKNDGKRVIVESRLFCSYSLEPNALHSFVPLTRFFGFINLSCWYVKPTTTNLNFVK